MYLLLYYYCKYTFYSFDLENDFKMGFDEINLN